MICWPLLAPVHCDLAHSISFIFNLSAVDNLVRNNSLTFLHMSQKSCYIYVVCPARVYSVDVVLYCFVYFMFCEIHPSYCSGSRVLRLHVLTNQKDSEGFRRILLVKPKYDLTNKTWDSPSLSTLKHIRRHDINVLLETKCKGCSLCGTWLGEVGKFISWFIVQFICRKDADHYIYKMQQGKRGIQHHKKQQRKTQVTHSKLSNHSLQSNSCTA